MIAPADTIVARIERQAATRPHAAAVRDRAGVWSCARVNARANQLARALRERSGRDRPLVALALSRSVDLPAAMLAALKTGGAYLPLDPNAPPERTALMLEDAKPDILACDTALEPSPPEPAVLRLDEETEFISAQPARDLGARIEAGDLAYVIYTSGSTGRPKGVEIEHRSLANVFAQLTEAPGLGEGETIAAVTTAGFDIAAAELLSPLTVGACVAIVEAREAADGRSLREALDRIAPDVMQATPSTWSLLLAAGWSGGAALRAWSGGEALSAALASRLRERCAEVWNLYGPTETTIWSSLHQVLEGAMIPVGRPVRRTRIAVLGASAEPLAPGEEGEVWIGGAGVARGYRNAPRLTAERFQPDPDGRPGARRYATGDRGRLAGDRLHVCGRLDAQVKIRGVRVELGEVEAVFAAMAGVSSCAAVMQRGDPARLIVFAAPEPGARLNVARLREAALRRLPEAMRPDRIVILDKMPLSANGKIDRAALVAPADPRAGVAAPYRAPEPGAERAIAAIWSEVLHVDPVGADDTFLELGGHSLAATLIATRVEAAGLGRLPLERFLSRATVAEQARALRAEPTGAASLPAIAPAGRIRRAAMRRPITQGEAS